MWSTMPAPIASPSTLIVVRKRSLETRYDKTQLKIKVAFNPWCKEKACHECSVGSWKALSYSQNVIFLLHVSFSFFLCLGLFKTASVV
jgi:hypothetical protein